MIITDVADLRSCELFFLPLNPACTTTSTTTTAIVVTTTTTSTTITTTSTTTVYPPVTTTSTTTTTCQCYDGYQIAPDERRCIRTERTDATPPTNLQVSVAKSYREYSSYGTLLFDPGYNLNGTTSSGVQLLSTPVMWKNDVPLDTVKGPMNRCALWSTIYTDNQDVGFTYCIYANTTKTYYIGVGCDNYAIIRIDGVTIVSQDVTALRTQFGAGTSVTFRYWFIYPVELVSGFHVIEMIGHNVTSIAAMGAEIYDVTEAEIIAATDYTTFYNDHILFTTKDMIGETIQIGDEGYGWTCPDGYSLIMCDGAPYCININYLDCGESPSTTTTTTLIT